MTEIVSRDVWQAAQETFLAEEKKLGRERDALNARRRRLPLMLIGKSYRFDTTGGPRSLPELFEGRDQLIVYFNMLRPDSDHICPGCSYYCDHVGNLAHLHARRTTFVVISRATLSQIEAVRQRLGWTFPWHSSGDSGFYDDIVPDDASFGLGVFVRRGDAIYQSYSTTGRGVEQPSNTFGFLDITPWGRQETWEDSPPRTLQEPAHSWIHLHDEYPGPP